MHNVKVVWLHWVWSRALFSVTEWSRCMSELLCIVWYEMRSQPSCSDKLPRTRFIKLDSENGAQRKPNKSTQWLDMVSSPRNWWMTSIPASTVERCWEVNKWSKVNRTPSQGWMKHNDSHAVEIVNIVTIHTIVSQQEDQVRVVFIQRATQQEDRSQSAIGWTWSKAESNYLWNPWDINSNTES